MLPVLVAKYVQLFTYNLRRGLWSQLGTHQIFVLIIEDRKMGAIEINPVDLSF